MAQPRYRNSPQSDKPAIGDVLQLWKLFSPENQVQTQGNVLQNTLLQKQIEQLGPMLQMKQGSASADVEHNKQIIELQKQHTAQLLESQKLAHEREMGALTQKASSDAADMALKGIDLEQRKNEAAVKEKEIATRATADAVKTWALVDSELAKQIQMYGPEKGIQMHEQGKQQALAQKKSLAMMTAGMYWSKHKPTEAENHLKENGFTPEEIVAAAKQWQTNPKTAMPSRTGGVLFPGQAMTNTMQGAGFDFQKIAADRKAAGWDETPHPIDSIYNFLFGTPTK